MHGLSPSPPRQSMPIDIRLDIPAYEVVEPRGFYDERDRLWEMGSMIYWQGAPNPGFEPLNKLAEDTLRDYYTDLDNKANEVCTQKGHSHASLTNAFLARRKLQEMDKKMEGSVDEEEAKSILGAKHYGKAMAVSVDQPNKVTPIMGHQGRQSAVVKATEGRRNPKAEVEE